MIVSIYETNFDSKRVLVRVDFNVPINSEGKVEDDTRIVESLPTIDKIIDDGGIPILMSHLGRPKGAYDPKYSLKPVADYLHDVLGYSVIFANDCIGEEAEKAVKSAKPGDVVLLENVRFHKEETENDTVFAEKLALLGDCYVNDAFGSAHRAHASTHAVAQFFHDKYAGKLMMDELHYLGKALNNPRRPFVAILGGAKISGKIDVIKNLLHKCDQILIGGGMAFTFLKAKGYEIGKSILEEDKIELAKELLSEAEKIGVPIHIPEDYIVADAFSNEANFRCVNAGEINVDDYGMDIGYKTRENYKEIILQANTIIWNGPMGVFEFENFSEGTKSIALALAEATQKGAITVVGGGDSVSAVNKLNLKKQITHVSTGGGASLEFLEGKTLPGVAALEI